MSRCIYRLPDRKIFFPPSAGWVHAWMLARNVGYTRVNFKGSVWKQGSRDGYFGHGSRLKWVRVLCKETVLLFDGDWVRGKVAHLSKRKILYLLSSHLSRFCILVSIYSNNWDLFSEFIAFNFFLFTNFHDRNESIFSFLRRARIFELIFVIVVIIIILEFFYPQNYTIMK